MKQFLSKRKDFIYGVILAVIAVLIWSGNPLIATEMSDNISPVEFAFFRWFIAFFFLFALTFKKVKKEWYIIKKQWKLILALAFAVPVFDNLCFYTSGHSTSALNIALIGTAIPLFVVLLNFVFLKKVITNLQSLGIFIALFGVLYIITDGNFAILSELQFNVGDIFVLVATFSFSVYTFLQYKKDKNLSPDVFLTMIAGTGSLLLLPMFIVFEISHPHILFFSAKEVLTLLYTGTCVTIIAYLCWNAAVTKIGSLMSSILDYFSPFFVAIMVFLFLEQPIYASQIIGGGFIIFGCVLININNHQTN